MNCCFEVYISTGSSTISATYDQERGVPIANVSSDMNQSYPNTYVQELLFLCSNRAMTINNTTKQLSWIFTCCIYVGEHNLNFCLRMLFSVQSKKI